MKIIRLSAILAVCVLLAASGLLAAGWPVPSVPSGGGSGNVVASGSYVVGDMMTCGNTACTSFVDGGAPFNPANAFDVYITSQGFPTPLTGAPATPVDGRDYPYDCVNWNPLTAPTVTKTTAASAMVLHAGSGVTPDTITTTDAAPNDFVSLGFKGDMYLNTTSTLNTLSDLQIASVVTTGGTSTITLVSIGNLANETPASSTILGGFPGIVTFALHYAAAGNPAYFPNGHPDRGGNIYINLGVSVVQTALLTAGSNLVLNGDGAGATDWTGATGATPPTSWSVVNAGTFTITAAGQQSTNSLYIGYSATNPTITQGFTTISGHVYSLTYYFQKGTAASGSVYIGTTSGASNLYNSGALTDATWGRHATTFTAQGATTYISLVDTCSSTGTSGFDSFNLTEIAPPLELVSPQAASISVVANQLMGNYVFTNTGAAGAVIVTLPAGGVNNYSAEFEVTAGQYLEALANGSDTFKYYQTSGAAGGYVRSNVAGTRWKITWNGSAWSVHDLVGALNYDQ